MVDHDAALRLLWQILSDAKTFAELESPIAAEKNTGAVFGAAQRFIVESRPSNLDAYPGTREKFAEALRRMTDSPRAAELLRAIER